MNDNKYLTNEDISYIRKEIAFVRNRINYSLDNFNEAISMYIDGQKSKNLMSVGDFGEEQIKKLTGLMNEVGKFKSSILSNLIGTTEDYLNYQESKNNTME